MQYDEAEFLIEASRLADTLDMDVSLWHPNSDDETLEEAVAKRRELYKKVPRIDYLFIPGGDPGEYYADEFIERTKRFSEVLKEHHKNAKVYPAAQAPHKYRDWGDKLIEELEKDIIEYIDYYNNKRIKSKLKGMSPVQYRTHSLEVA